MIQANNTTEKCAADRIVMRYPPPKGDNANMQAEVTNNK